jgi:NitT/TauT family transport system substrate-binding protein
MQNAKASNTKGNCMRKAFVQLLFGCIASLQAADLSAQELVPVTLTTGWILAGNSSPLVLADQSGYFAEGGVKVNIVRGYGSADVITKVGAGTYQAGTGYLPVLVQAIAKDPSFDAIAVMISYDASPDSVTGPKTTGIKVPKDLNGRKVSAQPNAPTTLMFQAFAKAVGIELPSVKWVEVSPELMSVVVRQGQADGVAQYSSSALVSLGKLGYKPDDLYQFKFSDYVDNLYGNALIVQKSWAKAHPEAVKGLVRGYVRGLIEAYRAPKLAIDALMKREPLLTRENEVEDLRLANTDYYFTKNVLARGLAYQTTGDVDAFVKLLVEPLKLPRVPTSSEIYTDKYLPAAAERTIKTP